MSLSSRGMKLLRVISCALAYGVFALIPTIALGNNITGTVTDSLNNPLSFAYVVAYSLNAGSWDFSASTRTDANGTYDLSELSGGTYRVFFAEDAHFSEWYDDAPTVDEATDVSVAAGAITSGIDAQLTLGGRITGTVTDSLGNPIADVTALGYFWNAVGEFWDQTIHSNTTETGTYSLTGLPGGIYHVCFSYSNIAGLFQSVTPQCYDDAPFDPDVATDIPVTAGVITSGIDGQLVVVGHGGQTCNYDSIPATAPASRFTDNGDGTVTDQGTGLQWKRCSEGQSWDGTTCAGTATFHSWQQALQSADAVVYAGEDDWRIPSIKELASIVEHACSEPAFDLAVFPNASIMPIWSSSPSAQHPDYAWSIDTISGVSDGNTNKEFVSHNVLLVRGLQAKNTLNDTGLDWWTDADSNFLSSEPIDYPGQDASHGRDQTDSDDADGHAGFAFTKLDANGSALPASATDWSCVRDEVTGLVWEVKTDDGNLHDRDDRYTWYNTDASSNGGFEGSAEGAGATCSGYDAADPGSWCNTQAYVARVNAAGWCGVDDWRMPNNAELRSVVDFGHSDPPLDTDYFPLTTLYFYWSASPTAYYDGTAWSFDFSSGYEGVHSAKDTDYYVRLVSGVMATPPPQPDGLSCTADTLGLPLDSTACFYDGTARWRKAILKKAGVVVAEASLAGNEGGFCANNLLWLDATGRPISNWSELFAGADTVAVELSVEHTDGSTSVLENLTASRSQFEVAVTADETFPMSGPQAEATFTATPEGGTAPYTYAWTKVVDYAVDGYGHQDWGTSDITTIELPAYGEKYPSYPARWGSFNSLHPINLQVSDSTGAVATLECLAAVTGPHLNGDPAVSGSGSRLMRGVDVASGNYHMASTDLSVPGRGPAFAVTRAYNANMDRSGRWTFNLDLSVYFETHSMGREIAVGPREDGRKQRYYRELDGTWRALNPGNFDELRQETDGSFVLYTQGNLLYLFAAPGGEGDGRLEGIEDRDGNALTFSHTDNRVTGAIDASGRNYTIVRDGNGRITRVTDFTGRYVEYTWNTDGMITGARNARGFSTTYGYSSGSAPIERRKLTSITDPRGSLQATVAYYDSGSLEGKVESVTDGAGNQWGFLYGVVNGNGAQMTAITRPAVDGENNNLVFVLDDARTRVLKRLDTLNAGEYDDSRTAFESTTERTRIAEMALPVKTYRPSNAKTAIAYDARGKGNPETITHPKTDADPVDPKTLLTWGEVTGQFNLTPMASVKRPGVETSTRYSAFTPSGKARTIVDPLGNTTQRDYDAAGQLVQTTDAENNTTAITYSYDAQGRRHETVTDALGNLTETTYDVLGRVLSERDARGHVTSHTYDANGNLLTTTDPAGGVTTNVYDESDNLKSTTDARGNTTTYVYDALSRKTEERYTVGGVQHTRRYSYDAMGRLASVTNERDQTTHTHYTARSKVAFKVNALAETAVSYTYDPNGNVETVTDGEGRTLTYEYDAIDRKTRTTDDQGNYQKWTYNPAGQVATYRDSRGRTTSYEYDAVGNLTQLTDPEGGVTSATYDGNGNKLTVTDPNGHTTTYTYDALNRRTSTRLHDGQQWTYSYDANGNPLQETTPNDERTERVYDALNRVTQLTEYNATGDITRQIAYTYDANGNVLSESSSGNTISYTYDEINRVTSVTDQYGQTVGYGYDKAGNRTALVYPGNKTVSYSYDEADRLESLTDWLNKTTHYTRNAAGQPIEVLYGNGAKVQYSYDDAGRLAQLNNLKPNGSVISSHDLTLDGAGNITRASMELPLLPTLLDSTGALAYDNNNRIQTAGTKSYIHDPSGRIIEEAKDGTRTIYQFDINDHITAITRNGATLSSYGYDLNNNRIRQVQNGTETRYVIDPLASLPNVVAETDASGAISNYYVYGEGLVSQISAANDSRYYHFDPTGHTLALTDENGDVTDTYAYAPYGHTSSQGSTENPFRFVGKYGVMDDGNGLHYMRARYYREDIKRFISLDALHGDIATPQALNRYAYVQGNPVVGIDPAGRELTYGSFWYRTIVNIETLGKAEIAVVKGVTGNIVKSGRSLGDEINGAIDLIADGKVNEGLKKINIAIAVNVGGGMADSVNPLAYSQHIAEAAIDELYVSNDFKSDLKSVNNLVFLAFSFRNIAMSISAGGKAIKDIRRAKQALKTLMTKHGTKATSQYKGIFTIWVNVSTSAGKLLEKIAPAIGAQAVSLLKELNTLRDELIASAY